MLEIIGYMASIFIGVSLGLIGGGGSILTVPVLVYLMNIEPVPATAYSLFIVGITSLIGALTYVKKEQVNYSIGIIFALPALITVYLTRRFIVPAIPDIIISFDSISISKNLMIMGVFAVLMFLASISMIRNNSDLDIKNGNKLNIPLIFIEGIIVGFFTGIVGAGGGFLIIPALVLLAKLPMKIAVGTSLMIIAIKSLIGFIGDLEASMQIDWSLLIIFSVLAIIGIFIGSYLSNKISNKKLKPAFGWFVLVMSIYIIVKELYTNFN